MPRPLSELPKQLLDSPHRQEESFLNFGQFNESVSPVESSRELILCVYDNTRRRDLLSRIKAAVEGIHEQDLTEARPRNSTLAARRPRRVADTIGYFGSLFAISS